MKRPLRWLSIWAEDLVPLALFVLAAAVVVAALVAIVVWATAEPAPTAREEIEGAIKALRGEWCSDPRGTLADGSCGE